MKAIKRLPMFRNSTSRWFSLLLGSSTALYGYKKWSDARLEHPLVKETIEVLRKEKQIQELVGVPVKIKYTFRQEARLKEDKNNATAFFQFQVKGPRGVVDVEVQGQGQCIGEVQSKHLDDYYIPDPEVLQCLETIHEGGKQEAPSSSRLWKINYLFADVGPNIRITFKEALQSQQDKLVNVKATQQDQPKQEEQNKKEESINKKEESVNKKEESINRKEESVNKKEESVLEQLLGNARSEQVRLVKKKEWAEMSEQEMEERRQQRMQQMYGKVGMSRFLSLAGVFMLGGGLYLYLQSTKSRNVVNTALYSNCVQLVKHNPQLRKHLGAGQQLSINKSVKGQWVQDKAEFSFDVLSAKGSAVARAKGTLDETQNQWTIDSLDLDILVKGSAQSIQVRLK